MKALTLAAGLAILGGSAAMAGDFNFTVTNMMEPGKLTGPIIVVDAARAEATMFNGGKPSEAFTSMILNGDPRPMNGTMPDAVAGPILGTSGPPGVLINGGETASADMFIEATTLRFYARANFGDDWVVSGVWDIAMGGGEVMLHAYDIGSTEGTGKITVAQENVIKLVITEN